MNLRGLTEATNQPVRYFRVSSDPSRENMSYLILGLIATYAVFFVVIHALAKRKDGAP